MQVWWGYKLEFNKIQGQYVKSKEQLVHDKRIGLCGVLMTCSPNSHARRKLIDYTFNMMQLVGFLSQIFGPIFPLTIF